MLLQHRSTAAAATGTGPQARKGASRGQSGGDQRLYKREMVGPLLSLPVAHFNHLFNLNFDVKDVPIEVGEVQYRLNPFGRSINCDFGGREEGHMFSSQAAEKALRV